MNCKPRVVSSWSCLIVFAVLGAVAGALFARVIDVAAGGGTGRLTFSNSVENSAEAEEAVDAWARILRQRLDAVRAHPPSAATD